MFRLVSVNYLMYSLFGLCVIVLVPSIKGDDCNVILCAPVVSKCILIEKCRCNLSDCYCCKDCIKCLGDLYTDCCGCLGMCQRNNDSLSSLAPKSQVGNFSGVPELFDIIAAGQHKEKFTTLRFPMRKSLQLHYNMAVGPFNFSLDIVQKRAPNNVICTVIYLDAYTTNKKCSQYCENVGSKSYRWFHNGCCECVGDNCNSYGINESLCAA